MDVSSVHWPGSRRKGPPPTISEIGVKLPRERNSRVVPTASPTARPRRQARFRESGSAVLMLKMLTLGKRSNAQLSSRIGADERAFTKATISLIDGAAQRTANALE